MSALIQVCSRPGAGVAQARITAAKSWSTAISKGACRTVLRRVRGTWNPSSGMIPRARGSIQRIVFASALSAIGNTPAV